MASCFESAPPERCQELPSVWDFSHTTLHPQRDQLHAVADGVFAVELFERGFVSALSAQIEAFQQQAVRDRKLLPPPSVLVHEGVVVNAIPGAPRFFEQLILEYLSPVVAAQYPQYKDGLCCDDFLALLVHYSASRAAGSKAMRPHCDESCVTLSICLGEEFKGGELVIEGTRISQRPGHAILFPGSMEHYTTPLTRGSRTNLVVWCVSNRKVDQVVAHVCKQYIPYLEAAIATDTPTYEQANRRTSISFDVPTVYMTPTRGTRCKVPPKSVLCRLEAGGRRVVSAKAIQQRCEYAPALWVVFLMFASALFTLLPLDPQT